jgi:plasmid stability protein
MIYVMPSLLQIRNVPEATRRTLKARAAAGGESLNSYLLAVLEREAARPTVSQVLERAATRGEHAEVSALEVITAERAEREEQLRGRATR